MDIDTAVDEPSAARDRFGFPIDPSVGYARGQILDGPVADMKRLTRARQIAADYTARSDEAYFTNLTGNAGDFPLRSSDLELCNEWTAPGIFHRQLHEHAREHLGGADEDDFALIARTSSVLVAWMSLFGSSRPVLSVVPSGGHSHHSLRMGAHMAGSQLTEVSAAEVDRDSLDRLDPQCAVITSVTSSLEELTSSEIVRVASLLRERGCVVLLDDAYGARVRPVLRWGLRSLQTGVDVAVTNVDKAALGGPRAALVGGRRDLVEAVSTWCAEAGMDARGPIVAATVRALEDYDPIHLKRDAADGQLVSGALMRSLGAGQVQPGLLGPTIREEDALELAIARSGGGNPHAVRPCEVTAAIGISLLRQGIVTVNALGPPGARVSLRMKPTAFALERAGGEDVIAGHLDDALDEVSQLIQDIDSLRTHIIGEA